MIQTFFKVKYMRRKYTALGDLIQVTQSSYPPSPPLLYSYPFLNSLHPFMSFFPMCDMCSGIWNRWNDYVEFVNVCFFSAYLETSYLKTFWSLVILILNFLNFGFEVQFTWSYKWSVVLHSNVTDLKYA